MRWLDQRERGRIQVWIGAGMPFWSKDGWEQVVVYEPEVKRHHFRPLRR